MLSNVQKHWFVCFWIAFISLLPNSVHSVGSVFLLPTQSKHTLGNIFEISVVVDTSGKIAKQVDGAITFDNSIIRVESINLDNTIVDQWLVEPTYVNNRGKISFVGKLSNVNDDDALLMTIIFTSIKTGDSEINISAGQVLAAETGNVNIAGALGSATVIIENPLSYGLDDNEIDINPNLATAVAEERIRLHNYSTEWLYRLLLLLLVAVVVGLNWLIGRFINAKR